MALPAPSVGSTCLISGASSGIGADIARELAARGYGLTMVARREDRLRALAETLHAEHGVTVDVLPADLSDAAVRSGLWEAIQERGRVVEVLVNNALLNNRQGCQR